MNRIFLIAAVVLLGINAVPEDGYSQGASPPGLDDFVIRPGNFLKIRIWPDVEPSMSGDFVVESTGLVYLPALGGVRAGGVPLLEFQKILRDRYSEVIKEPVVTVSATYPILLIGGVGAPGLYHIQPTTTLQEAIAMAGGFTRKAKTSELMILRNDNEIRIDAKQAMTSAGNELAISLQSGDRITVPERGGVAWMNLFYAFQFVGTVILLAKQIGS